MNSAVPDKLRVAASFSRAARDYDHHASLQREVADALLQRIDTTRPVRRILDLGSGTGYCSGPLLERFPDAELISLDIAPGMLRYAREHHPALPADYVCGDAEALPLADDTVDLVFSSLAIQWCGDCAGLFAEVCRVARPGSQCLFTTFDEGTLRELREAWAAVDARVHVNGFTPAAILRDCLAALPVTGLHSECQALLRHYPGLRALASELKGVGAHNMNAGQPTGLMGRTRLARPEEAFLSGAGPEGRAVTWRLHQLDFTLAGDGIRP